jgi:DNA-binding IscR family transcriptional regulator
VAFIVQHPNQVNDDEDSSAGERMEHSLLTAVRVMQLIASRFYSGEKPYTPEDLADYLQLDHASVHDSVGLLADGGLVFRGEESCGSLCLGKPAEAITLKDIFQVVDKDLNGQAKLGSGDACFEIYHKIIRDRDQSAASVKLSDLV